MGAAHQLNDKPDLTTGLDANALKDGDTCAGRVGDELILLSRRGDAYFAVSGACTHYDALLAEGLIDGDHAVCPLHHACFSLRTGEVLHAPAFEPLRRWEVEVEGGRIFVRSPQKPHPRSRVRSWSAPRRIVIVGGGAAGFAAADTLRRRGYASALTMLSSDSEPPCDRPNLSKDFLAGKAPEDWIPLRTAAFYRDNEIDLRLATTAYEIDPKRRRVTAGSGEVFTYDRLLLATGAEAARLDGFNRPNVYTLRTPADARAITDVAHDAKRVVIVGAGFVGMEAAAALRTRGLDVHVITPEAAPMLRLLGPEVADFISRTHKRHGVHFHFGRNARRYDGRRVLLDGTGALEADFVIVAVGARPSVGLASRSGLKVSNGVEVDAFMRSSDPNVFAAGDIALYPDALTRRAIRIEHWVTAQRQGQTAAINMLGGNERFHATPFFWSDHFEHSLHYVGHAPRWTNVEIDGDITAANFSARYMADGQCVAAAFVGRNQESIHAQRAMDTARRAALA